MTIPSLSSDKIVKVLIRTISSLSRVHKALLVNIIKRLLNELSIDYFLAEKILQFASRITPQAFNAIKKAFNDEYFAFKVIKSVGTALLPGFINILLQR